MILYFTNTLPEKIILKIERRAQSFYFWWGFYELFMSETATGN